MLIQCKVMILQFAILAIEPFPFFNCNKNPLMLLSSCNLSKGSILEHIPKNT